MGMNRVVFFTPQPLFHDLKSGFDIDQQSAAVI